MCFTASLYGKLFVLLLAVFPAINMCLCVRFCVSIVVITLLSFEQFADAAFDSAQICRVTLLLFKFYVHYLSLSRSTFMVGAHVCSEHIT